MLTSLTGRLTRLISVFTRYEPKLAQRLLKSFVRFVRMERSPPSDVIVARTTVACVCGFSLFGCREFFFLFPELLEDSRALRILLSLSPKCPCFLKRKLPKFLPIILSGQPNYNRASTMIVNSEEGIYIEISKVHGESIL